MNICFEFYLVFFVPGWVPGPSFGKVIYACVLDEGRKVVNKADVKENIKRRGIRYSG